MKLKDIDDSILGADVTIRAVPCSCYSTPQEYEFRLSRESDLRLTVRCPNGSCTARQYGFDVYAAVRKAVETGQERLEAVGECEGWEDESRKGRFKCLSKFHLSGTLHIGRRNHASDIQ